MKTIKSPWTGKWINKMYCGHILKYYSEIKIDGSTDACHNLDEFWKFYSKCKNAFTKD
jgi:hypothetical protein